MPVEEIVLSLPEVARAPDDNDGAVANGSEELIRHYQQLLASKRRFAWTRRARLRRAASFDAACKSLAKQLARESTAAVENRATRLEARTRIYATVGGLLSVNAMEAQRSALRNLFAVRYALLLGVLGGASLTAMVALGLRAQIPL